MAFARSHGFALPSHATCPRVPRVPHTRRPSSWSSTAISLRRLTRRHEHSYIQASTSEGTRFRPLQQQRTATITRRTLGCTSKLVKNDFLGRFTRLGIGVSHSRFPPILPRLPTNTKGQSTTRNTDTLRKWTSGRSHRVASKCSKRRFRVWCRVIYLNTADTHPYLSTKPRPRIHPTRIHHKPPELSSHALPHLA